MFKSNEQLAIEVGNDRKLLLKRLKDAKYVLTDEYRKIFKDAKFEFGNKRLLSKCGNYALQWQVRYYPDEPVSYENQQTNRGIVVVYHIKTLEQHIKDQEDELITALIDLTNELEARAIQPLVPPKPTQIFRQV